MKTSKPHGKGYQIRADCIRKITAMHYEPGRQDRNFKWVWKHHVQPVYGIGYRTYLSYLDGKTREAAKSEAAE